MLSFAMVLLSILFAACVHVAYSVYLHDDSSASHLVSSVGAESVGVHFPIGDHLERAVHHAWAAMSVRPAPVIGCTTPRSAKRAVREAAAANLSSRVVFHSSAENIACIKYDGWSGNLDYFEQSAIEFRSVFPHLPVFKLDISIPHVLGFIEDNRGGVPLSSSLRDMGSRHPMVRDYAATEVLELQVIFSPTVLRQHFSSLSAAWLKGAAEGATTHEAFYWTSAVSGERIVAGAKAARKRGFSLDRRVRSLLSPYRRSSAYRPQEQWRRWREQWQDADCMLDSIGVRHRSRASFLSYDLRPVAESMRGACLALIAARIAIDPAVAQVGLSRPIRLQNKITRSIVQGDEGKEPFKIVGLDGSGEIVGQSDTGIDHNSCFFVDPVHGPPESSSVESPAVDLRQRKVVQYINYSGSEGDYAMGHGSHTAGTIIGNCIDPTDELDSDYNGIAYGARIAVFDIGKPGTEVELAMPDDIRDIFSPSYFAGARVHSNSWGGGYWYDSYALETDEYAFENDDFLAFFAGGNDGAERTVLSPAMAKNAVAVAASNQFPSNTLAGFSSYGPVFDGRIKPDITLPGSGINSASAQPEGSTEATCDLRTSSGTSMATPAAAGSAALMRQYFRDSSFWASYCNQNYPLCKGGPFSPTAYLLKAVVLHSGVGIDSGVTGPPDQHQGYGLLDLASVLPLNESTFSLFVGYGSLSDFEQIEYLVEVKSSSVPLKVTVSWFDPPNDSFMAKVLLHDLDLILVSPEGVETFGNCPSTDGKSHPECIRDELNNNEQVTVASPSAGSWKVLVQSKLLSQSDTQQFGLVLTGDAIVSEPELSDVPDVNDLSYCPLNSDSMASFQLQVAMMDLFYSEGWRGSDKYMITDSSNSLINSGALESGLPYDIDDVCLSEGDYSIELSFGSESQQETTQLELADCGVFLTPLSRSQKFSVIAPSTVSIGSGNYDVYGPKSCFSSCEDSPHVSLLVDLTEYSCEGWNGIYYAVYDGKSGITAGAMEWGCEMQKSICLPAVAACYTLHLYIPEGMLEDYEPIMGFTDSFIPTGDLAVDACPHVLSTESTIAKVCVNEDLSSATVSFYDSSVDHDYSQRLVTWNDVNDQLARTNVVGTCQAPINSLSVDGHSLSCMRSCLGFPDTVDTFSDDLEAVCDFFLGNVYTNCGTFGVSRYTCSRPACAEACSLEDWCYFGATSAYNCGWSTPKEWLINEDVAVMEGYCMMNSISISEIHDEVSHMGYFIAGLCLIISVICVVVIVVVIFPRRKYKSTSNAESVAPVKRYNEQLDDEDVERVINL